MATKEMTRREFLQAIVGFEGMTDELKAFAEEEIKKMDAANAKRKEKTSEKAKENEPLLKKIEDEFLSDTPITASEVQELMELGSVQKASYLLRELVKEGRAEVQDVKVPKKGNQKGYTKVTA